uniref:G patch domain and KOW motifs-containing protein n=1 Tax=Culex pipiens TaxID=7175 RepID=A0A8D8PAR2_CULPI
MEMKKISFGFSKSVRKGPLKAGPSAIGVREKDDRDKIELISCVEEQSIRVVGKENGDGEVKDLVIPLREQDKTTVPGRLAKLQEIKEDRGLGVVVVAGEKRVETLEQKAAREIMEELKERQDNFGKEDNFVVPLKPEDLPLEGARESTLDDYEAIPIESFGMAMLRGMGFKEDPAKKKDKDDKLLPEGPMMRPKGLGLGAERAPKDASKQLIPPAKDEVLAMRNGAFVKVLTGRQKDAYGTVESLNEDTGRVMVKFAIGGNRDYVNEYLLQLVSRAEFDQYGKVLNKEKYEEYKKRQDNDKTATSEELRLQKELKKESPPPRVTSRDDRTQQHSSRSQHREDRDREDRHSRQDRDRDPDRRRDSSTSEDDSRHRSHHKPSRTSSGTKKKSHKYKQHRREYSRERDRGSRDRERNYRRGSSDEDEETRRRDAHKQKKTKKSKRQRSRSR